MKCTIIGHNGWTDYISQYSLRKYFIEGHDSCLLFVDSEEKIPFVKSLYPETSIEVLVPITTNQYDGIKTCICCHTLGSPSICPRSRKECKFIDYSQYEGCKHICLNAFDNYTRWESFFQGKGFLQAMYSYYDLDFLETIVKFPIPLSMTANIDFLVKLNLPNDYIIIHDNKATGLVIHNRRELPDIRLDGISKNITDTILTLLQAKEIHCIDSVYMFLILILYHQYRLFVSKPIYLYRRSTDLNGPFNAIQPYLHPDWHVQDL